jgi:leucine dehydrogenase
MRACAEHRFGIAGLAGRSVAVVGAGHVGEALARMLAADGARVIVSDIDEGKRALAGELPGATWMSPGEAMLAEVDVLAPCALGGVLDDTTVTQLGAGIVCGAANNQLAHDALAGELAHRGIDYVPDFVANAGGLMRVAAELEGADGEGVQERIAGIEPLTRRILTEAAGLGITPLAAAHAIAERRLARPLATV